MHIETRFCFNFIKSSHSSAEIPPLHSVLFTVQCHHYSVLHAYTDKDVNYQPASENKLNYIAKKHNLVNKFCAFFLLRKNLFIEWIWQYRMREREKVTFLGKNNIKNSWLFSIIFITNNLFTWLHEYRLNKYKLWVSFIAMQFCLWHSCLGILNKFTDAGNYANTRVI